MRSATMVDALAGWMAGRSSRRRFLQRVAVVGSAVTVAGWDYVLKPTSAYASVCGSGTSCSSGWTAMCCTINKGVNQCPPGSFAAGWWKADGASTCGGKARYIVDCQARCTHCGCPRGSHFCGSSCWNCRSHCADGTCDKRRVCHNVFRYGQCHREISCSGPVWCRMITCTPPWKYGPCSSASATDNNTRTHSSTCLTNSWTPLQARYTALGSQWSPLGASVGPEHVGWVAHNATFEHGRMYYSSSTKAHYVLGALAAKYVALNQGRSVLGLPTSDTVTNADKTGRHNTFQHGVIYTHPRAGTHAVTGAALTRWTAERRETGRLGYPTADSATAADKIGQTCVFEHGSIVSSTSTGTRIVMRPLHDAWMTTGGVTGSLGYPVIDTATNADGVGAHNDFQHGAVYTAPTSGTRIVPADILAVWHAHGRETGPLGYPTGALAAQPDGLGATQPFAHGAIDRHKTLGVHAVWGPIFDRWVQDGRESGSLGYPTSDVHPVSNGEQACDFEHGTLTLHGDGTITRS